MYHKNTSTVRRSHSFDSADNLERWQAIRDHRKQFLSTRAKFDKVPPSEPPPPPPRQESKRTMLLNRSGSSSFSSATSSEGQTYYFKSSGTERYQRNVNSSFSRKNNEPKRSNSFQKYLTDQTNKYPQFEKQKLEKTCERQKSHIELKQSWVKFKDRSNQLQSFESVSEPLAVKKTVDHLGYEVPTPFQEVGFPAKKLHQSPDMSVEDILTVDSDASKIETYGKEDIKVSHEPGNDYYLMRPSDYYKGGRVAQENQNFEESSNISILSSKNQDLLYQDNCKKQEEKSNLDSNWKIFADSLLDAIDSAPVNDLEDKSLSNISKPVESARPRRVSTGSVHDPIVWRSLYPSTPVKTLVQKFSKK